MNRRELLALISSAPALAPFAATASNPQTRNRLAVKAVSSEVEGAGTEGL